MNVKRDRGKARPWALLALTAAVIAAPGCVETELTGVIVEQDVRDPDLMLALVRGINSEFTDNWYDFDGWWWIGGAATDDFNNDGTATSEEVYTVGEYRERPGGWAWASLHESAWAGYYGVQVLEDVFGEDEASRSPLVSQSWFNSAISERLLGETYCQVIYNYGPGAGALIGPNDQYDATELLSPDSAFRRAINAHEQGLAIAERALADGTPAPDSDPIFDPQFLVHKHHAGIAQAAVMIDDWDLAVQHASLVPDDFIAYSHNDPETEDNSWYEVSFQNDDFTLWNTPLHRQFADDPRAPWIRCGDFDEGDAVMVHGSSGDIHRTGFCDDIPGKNSEFRAESNTQPLFASMKSEEPGLLTRPGGETGEDADMPLMRGTEMRLIRAEAALLQGDLVGFTEQVNAARAVYDMEPIEQPATAGALEYPNAEDDAWSILDRERYVLFHLEGRRFGDMRRWEHPYIGEGHMVNTRVLVDYGEHRPAYCIPLPQNECDLNEGLFCETPDL